MNDNPQRFLLFLCGDTAAGAQAAQRVANWSQRFGWHIEIVDVLSSPEKAEAHRILATPTLLREMPKPERRVVGDLRDEERVFLALLVSPESHETRIDV